jgi:tetratricopeptide (TPR) repeat protein
MKRTERHRLKENPLARFVADLREQVASYGRYLAAGVIVVGGAAVASGGYWVWHTRQEAAADALLVAARAIAEAPVIPRGTDTSGAPPTGLTHPSERARLEAALPAYLRVAETYPRSRAAITALYEAGSALAALGRLDEAAKRYREVMARDGNGLYGQMAELGLAAVHVAAGRTAEAIEIYRRLASSTETLLPVDGILMELARAYLKAGQTAEATRTYTRVVEEFPQSIYASEAREALEALRPS